MADMPEKALIALVAIVIAGLGLLFWRLVNIEYRITNITFNQHKGVYDQLVVLQQITREIRRNLLSQFSSRISTPLTETPRAYRQHPLAL